MKAWAVINRKGQIQFQGIGKTKTKAINAFGISYMPTWKVWEQIGYTCQKIEITKV